jgi:hypothetical protein
MMSQNKMIAFGLLLLAAIVAWYYYNNKKKNQQSSIYEPFMPSLTYKVDKVYDASAPYGGTGQGDFLSVPGTFQSLVPPRFGMLDGAVVSVPTKNGSLDPGIAPLYKNLDSDSMAFNPSSPLQQGIMDDNGEMIQPVVYDRIIYANRRSRLLEGADFIRGDLPIFPQNLGWFSPSVQPHIDLRKGIIDNFDKDTADQLRFLQMKSEGKLDRAFEGEMIPPNTLIPSYGTFINPSVGDVEIVNFE